MVVGIFKDTINLMVQKNAIAVDKQQGWLAFILFTLDVIASVVLYLVG
jgi:hypothetical protein